MEIQNVLEVIDRGNMDELPVSFRVIGNELCRLGDILRRSDRFVVPVS